MTDSVPHIKPFRLDNLQGVAADAVREIDRQDQLARAGKFGGTHILPGGPHADRLGVLVEEVGEVAEAVNELKMGNVEDERDLYEELVQTAACAIAWATAVIEVADGYRE